jgi:hypothetical protein
MHNRTELDAALAAHTAARARHAADAEALARGRERFAAAADELQRLATLDDEAIARHAKRLEQQTREGKNGPLPALVPSDKHLAAQIAASRTHAAAQQMVASLEQAEKCSAQELVAAERAEQQVRDALKRAEADAIAGRILEWRRREHEDCARLVALDLDTTRTGSLLTPRAVEVLQSPPGPPSVESLFGHGIVADVHTPLCGDVDALAAARNFWEEFDARLDDVPGPAPAERAA